MAREREGKRPAQAEAQDVVELHAGQFVWYVPANEALPRPATLLSDGICETVTLKLGGLKQFANLIYGTADPGHALLGNPKAEGARQLQTHETTVPWDPSGAAGTWHLPGECEHIEHPKMFTESAPQAP